MGSPSNKLEELQRRLAEAEQTVRAFSSGEVDAVANEAGETPLLLRAAQEKLLESERLLRAVFDGALDAMLLADDRGRYVDANQAACDVFGLPREQLLGRRISEFVEPRADAGEAWAQFLRIGRREGQFRLARADGQMRHVDLRATANILPGLHLSIIRDITEREQANEMAARLAAIVESADDAILSKSPDGVITSWNRGAQRLYQWSAAEAIGKHSALIIPAALQEDERLILDRVLRGESIEQYATRRIRKDKSVVEVAVTISPIRDATGNIIGASKTHRDLTERRKAEADRRHTEEQLVQVQRLEAIGVLAGGVAHDFNNLLSVIMTYAILVLEELKPDQPLYADIVEIRRAAERATELTRQLLAFGRQQMLDPRVLEPSQVVLGMENMLKHVLGEAIELSLITSNSLGRVYADPSQLEQIVMNLVVNARDAMARGGTLSIEIVDAELDAQYAAEHHDVKPGPYVALVIADTGPGMDAATRERIFEPFFTTKEMGKGTGLGLSTVFGIVKQSQGHISVGSELGRGTTFKVYFPRTDRAIQTFVSVRAPPTSLRGSETILLVEDEDQLRIVTRTVLRRHGYRVLDAQNAGEAFLICEKYAEKIQLLLTDVMMPRMSGRELAKRLEPMRPEMRVLYVSGYTENSIVHHGVLDPGIAFLQKPITPNGLLLKVREVLDADQCFCNA